MNKKDYTYQSSQPWQQNEAQAETGKTTTSGTKQEAKRKKSPIERGEGLKSDKTSDQLAGVEGTLP